MIAHFATAGKGRGGDAADLLQWGPGPFVPLSAWGGGNRKNVVPSRRIAERRWLATAALEFSVDVVDQVSVLAVLRSRGSELDPYSCAIEAHHREKVVGDRLA